MSYSLWELEELQDLFLSVRSGPVWILCSEWELPTSILVPECLDEALTYLNGAAPKCMRLFDADGNCWTWSAKRAARMVAQEAVATSS